MAQEDFTTYTKVDPNSRFTVTAPKVVFTGMTQMEDAYIYKDKGAGWLTGDFTETFDCDVTGFGNLGSRSLNAVVWSVTTWIGSGTGGAGRYALQVWWQPSSGSSGYIFGNEHYNGSDYGFGAFACSTNTIYYLTITRTGGNITMSIYSDNARTNQLYTFTHALQDTHTYRYVYAIQSYNNGIGGTAYITGNSENLYLIPSAQYTMVTAPASFAYTPVSVTPTKLMHLITDKATYILTGMSSGLKRSWTMITSSATFTLTTMGVGFKKIMHLITSPATYTFTGIAVGINKSLTMITAPAKYILTGSVITFTKVFGKIVDWLNPHSQDYPKSKEQSYPKAKEIPYPQSKNNSKEIK